MLFVSRNGAARAREKNLAPHRVIQQTNKCIAGILTGDLKILRKLSSYVVESGGKRIRPLFLYYLGKSHGHSDSELIQLGALLEIVHAASLLHDDVVDHAEERRNRPTGAKLFGNKHVILGGDHLLSSGLKYLNSLGNPKYMDVFTDAIRALSEAELLQMQHHFDLGTSLKTHARVVDGKTGVLFRAAGALVGIQNGEADFYRSETAFLGEIFGRYFQHRDDFLDYFDAARLKKKGLQDFANGIVTRPLALLMAAANRADRAVLRQEWDFSQSSGRVRDEKAILSLMARYGIEKRCRADLMAAEAQILDKLALLPGAEPRNIITAEFQKILAVRAA